MRVVDLAEVRAARARASDEALGAARRLLGRRALSVHELATRLDAQGIEVEDRDAALERLQAEGALDDRALAEVVADRVRARRKGGVRAVAAELQRRGIAPCDHPAAADDDEELQRATELVLQRIRRTPIDETTERRMLAMLGRRGYAAAVTRAAWSEARRVLERDGEHCHPRSAR